MTMQLDFFTTTTVSKTLPQWGRVITSPRDNWRARWTGDRNGWVFNRRIVDEWETWEPDLPYGVMHVRDHTTAEQVVTDLIDRYGDTPL